MKFRNNSTLTLTLALALNLALTETLNSDIQNLSLEVHVSFSIIVKSFITLAILIYCASNHWMKIRSRNTIEVYYTNKINNVINRLK